MRFLSRAHGPACAKLEVKTQAEVVYLGSPETRMSVSDNTNNNNNNNNNDDDAPPYASTSSSQPIIPTSSASLRGSIRFTLETARTFESLRVELTGQLHVPGNKGHNNAGARTSAQDYETLKHNVDLLYDNSPFFAAGSHR